MELEEALATLKADLDAVTAAGENSVSVERLRQYLDRLNTQADRSREARQQWHEIGLENFRTVIAAGKEAINAIILINGGAAIALLAFLGNVLSRKNEILVRALALPLLLLSVGVLCGGIGFGLRYLSQFFYADIKSRTWTRKMGHCFNGAAWLVAVTGLLLFTCAMWATYAAVTSSPAY
jgi:hypothetical protein